MLRRLFVPKEAREGLSDIALSTVASFVVMALVFPALLVFHRFSFVRCQDTELNYQSVFALLTNFYHGGIQLWNMYDQMPLAAHHLLGGMYTWSSAVTAGAYALFSPFFSSPADAFHVIFSIFFYTAPMLVRAAGFYLLLKRFCPERRVLFTMCVLGNTLFVPHFHMGLNAGDCYAYFPLVAHFLLRFFEGFRLRDLLYAACLFTIATASYPLVGPGYFYQGIHFLLLAIVVWAVIFNRALLLRACRDVVGAFRPERRPALVRAGWKVLAAAVLCALIIAPSFLMMIGNFHDYEMDAGNSRFVNIWSVTEYFKRPVFFAPQKEFFWRWLDYRSNDWGNTWVFFGYLSLFLAVMGLALKRDSRKYIFLATMLLFWLINSPRTETGLSGLAHWLNAITNPLKFVPRSFHMVGAFEINFIFLPLSAMGAQALWDLFRSGRQAKDLWRLLLVAGILGAILASVFGGVSFEVKQYLARGAFLSLALLAIVAAMRPSGPVRNGLAAACLIALVFNDGRAVSAYIQEFAAPIRVASYGLQGLESAGEVNLDYRNPKILPRRMYYSFHNIGPVPFFIATDPLGMQGIYRQFTDLYKFMARANNYRPRHISYGAWPGDSKPYTAYTFQEWPGDKEMYLYLSRDPRLIYLAEHAVHDRPGIWSEILLKDWDRRVVVLNDGKAKDARVLDDLPGDLPDDKAPAEIEWQEARIPLNTATTAENYNLLELSLPLPGSFPSYLATTIFADDRALISAALGKDGEVALTPAQGKLVRPRTFDVNNMMPGRLLLMMEKGSAVSGPDLVLRYQKNERSGIVDIWKNEPDNFGFDYIAPHRGWLVIHYPYDKKWRMKIDGKIATIHRVNKSFLGVPIEEGKHRVYLQYWPGALLRPVVVLGLLAMVTTLWGVVFLGVREESCQRPNI